MRSLYQKQFARFYDRLQARYAAAIEPRKRELFAGLSGGTVVEIGPGTGANLELLAGCERWIGIESNPHMHEPLARRARELELETEFVVGNAQRIELAAGVADYAVSTLVLCSVIDPARVLSEIRRILRPGGRFLFIEHVAAPAGGWLRRWQRLMYPVWCVIGDGCRTTCETGTAIRKAGFSTVVIEEFLAEAVPPWVRPHIAGYAVR